MMVHEGVVDFGRMGRHWPVWNRDFRVSDSVAVGVSGGREMGEKPTIFRNIPDTPEMS